MMKMNNQTRDDDYHRLDNDNVVQKLNFDDIQTCIENSVPFQIKKMQIYIKDMTYLQVTSLILKRK